MHGGGCASCHGTDREGLRLFPAFWRKTPALTANALFGNEDLSHSDSSEHGHDPYTVQPLRVAITKGINPAGLPLNTKMPRWEMDERDLDDLINYLQQ
jgi:cytochrome c oxidase subunit 2